MCVLAHQDNHFDFIYLALTESGYQSECSAPFLRLVSGRSVERGRESY